MSLAVWVGCASPGGAVASPDDTASAARSPFTVVCFNTESGGSVASTVAASISAVHGESLWGFEEVADHRTAATYVAAAADDADHPFDSVVGTTGGDDLLVLAWDTTRFELESSTELSDIDVGGTVRAPLVGRMRDRTDGVELLFMVNHLWRTDDAYRLQQAQMLADWAREQTLPIVAVGDYNFDWAVQGGDDDHDAGYDALTADGEFVWVRPDALIRTQCSDYDSVLDFEFLGGPAVRTATPWTGTATILDRSDAYCRPSPERSDHRPVEATIQPGD